VKGKHPAELGLGHQTNFKIHGKQTTSACSKQYIWHGNTPYTVLLFGHVTGVRNQHSSVVQRVKKERGRSKKTNYS
jgi:hypothetical protein